MREPLYLGVTGFMTPQEVRAGLRCMENLGTIRKLMVGVLVSSKTLAGQTNKYPRRYPKIERVGEIFQDHPLALNLVHYNTDEPDTLYKQLQCLVEFSGIHLHGFQLNIAWPKKDEVERFQVATNWKFRIVLQIGNQALNEAGNNPRLVADRVASYWPAIDDILIDTSGGKGQPFIPEYVREYLTEIKARNPEVNLGVAGGLGPDRLVPLHSLLEEFPDINIDAQGQLRTNKDDDLDIECMCSYLEKSDAIFDGVEEI